VTARALRAVACAAALSTSLACSPSGPPPARDTLPVVTLQAPLDASARLDLRLRRDVLPHLRSSGRLRLTVDLVEQPDLVAVSRRLEAAGPSRAERKRLTCEALGGLDARRETFVSWLRARPDSGDVAAFRCVNRISLTGTKALAEALSARPEVYHVWGRRAGTEPPPADEPETVPGPAPTPEAAWALAALRAEEAWAAGATGQDVLVAVLDSGVPETHRALAGRRADVRAFDPAGAVTARSGAHGGAVLGAAVGSDGFGVAPEARWTWADPVAPGYLDPEELARVLDWILGTARPDVVIVPWDFPEDGPVDGMAVALGAMRTAGMAVVLAGGNRGPAPGSNLPPANLTGLAPDGAPAFAVGGVSADLSPYDFSSRGPNVRDGSTFPLVVAPASAIRVLDGCSPACQRVASGTSYACGLAGGAAALVMSLRPDLTGPAVERLLRETARDLGPPGVDDTYGAGLVDLAAAVERARGR
jgi:subtilisin family serine protease